MMETFENMSNPISAVVHTLNEEQNLPYLLETLRWWVDEILVIDMHSKDRTREIAEAFGCRVILHERLPFADPARPFGVKAARNRWVFCMDADEMVPLTLARRLVKVVEEDEADVVEIPWRNYILGSPLGHTSWGEKQEFHGRLFKKDMVKISTKVHTVNQVDSGARILRLPSTGEFSVRHFTYRSIGDHVSKINYYTDIEVQELVAGGIKHGYFKAAWSVLREFLLRFVYRKGFLDGWRGIYLTLLMMMYRVIIFAKLKALEECGSLADVESEYLKAKLEIVEEWKRVMAKVDRLAFPLRDEV